MNNLKKGFKEYREYTKSWEYLSSRFGTFNPLITWYFLDFLKYTKEEREQIEQDARERLKILLKELENDLL